MSRRPHKRRNPAGGRGSEKAQPGGLRADYNVFAESVAKLASDLPPGGGRLAALTDADGRLGPVFAYCFRTPDGRETIGIGPLPMPELADLSAKVEPVDAAMAKHMRHLLATWNAEQAGMEGHA